MRFQFTIVTPSFTNQIKAIRARTYGLSEQEFEEHVRLSLLKQLQDTRIGKCDVIDWGIYKDNE